MVFALFQAVCEALGGNLATPKNSRENSFIASLLSDTNREQDEST